MTSEPPRQLAVFSDIHGNLHALRGVLEAIDRLRIKTIVCCGDVIGYGAFPNECCELLRYRRIPTVAGNHDHAALDRTDIQYFNDIAKNALLWTRERLSPENVQWLGELPFTWQLGDDFYFVHASPHRPEQWGYVLTFGDARTCFEEFDERICFVGHSHQPAIVEEEQGRVSCPEGLEIPIRPGCRYLVNVGSVGQPRDQNPEACFVTVDLDAGLIQFHRVPYDIPAAQEAIVRANLPPELAERLDYGM